MNKMIAAVALLAVASMTVSCATPQTRGPAISTPDVQREQLAQQSFTINQRVMERRRVDQIHRRLSSANLEFCKIKTQSAGMGLHSTAIYGGRRFRDAAKAIGLSDAPTIAYVLDNTPASRAGLVVGDVILKVGDREIQPNASAVRRADRAISDWENGNQIPITVRRNGAATTIVVDSETICGFPVQIAEADEVNAYADGRVVVIPRGMIRFVENDDELALIIGHELAHNAMGHMDARRANQAMGMAGGLVLDVLIAATTGYASDTFSRAGAQAGAAAYSKAFESEADYAGVYFMTRAGFNTDNIENFWRRMAADTPAAIFAGQSHPTTPERYLAIAAARDEIRAKQLANLPLRPRMKGEEATAVAAVEAPAPVMAATAPIATPAVALAAPVADAATAVAEPSGAGERALAPPANALVSLSAPTTTLVPAPATQPTTAPPTP